MSAQEGAMARRRARGAALVEAAVITPVFLLLFAGLVFVSKLYLAKIEALEGARFGVWVYASSGCNSWADPTTVDPWAVFSRSRGSVSNGGVDANVNTTPVQGADRSAHVDVVSQTLGTASVSAQSKVISGALLGHFTAPVSAKTSVMCNEPPYNGSLPSMIVAAARYLTQW
jgi:hypothetical protein